MDGINGILLRLVEPFFALFLPHTRLFWMYLLAALIIAYFVYRNACRRGEAERSRFLEYVIPKHVYLHRSALVDYRYFVVNYLSFLFLLAPLLLSAPAVAKLVAAGLSGWLGPLAPTQAPGVVALALYTLAVALAFDLGIYLVHYALHRVPMLWEFHKVHHSAEVLTPITVYRVHPVDDLLYGVATGVLTGLAHGGFGYLMGDGVAPMTVLNINAAFFLFYLLGYNLRHSHIWLSYPGWLSRIVISPAQHQIHHSTDPEHLDKNMGFIFAFWDGIMNTLYVPRAHEKLTFGLRDDGARDYDGVLALYFVPFRNVLARWRLKWPRHT